MTSSLKELVTRYLPVIASLRLSQGLVLDPSWKSTAWTEWIELLPEMEVASLHERLFRITSLASQSSPLSWLLSRALIYAAASSFLYGHLLFGILSTRRIHGLLMLYLRGEKERRLDRQELISPYLPSQAALEVPAYSGRLCASCTGDGKRRVFAIGNYINQPLLAPLHQWLASVLKRIPMDGTFDQTRPLDLLSGMVSSIDLKSATALIGGLFFSCSSSCRHSSDVHSPPARSIPPWRRGFSRLHLQTAVCFVEGQP